MKRTNDYETSILLASILFKFLDNIEAFAIGWWPVVKFQA
jgi:hypothetical protein